MDFACRSQLANCVRTSASHLLFVINNIHNCLLIIDYCTFCQKQSYSRFVVSKLVVGLCEQAIDITDFVKVVEVTRKEQKEGFLSLRFHFIYSLLKFLAIIKKQGTSGLPEVHDNIDGTQSTPLIPSEISRENARAWVSMDFK